MTRDEVFKSIRTDEDAHRYPMNNGFVKVPVTRHGVMSLSELSAKEVHVPVDEKLIQVVCGFIHHLDRFTDSFEFEKLVSAVRKSYSNEITWAMSQEIEQKMRAEQAASNPKLTVVSPHEETNP